LIALEKGAAEIRGASEEDGAAGACAGAVAGGAVALERAEVESGEDALDEGYGAALAGRVPHELHVGYIDLEGEH
jgi:hypothetical protein